MKDVIKVKMDRMRQEVDRVFDVFLKDFEKGNKIFRKPSADMWEDAKSFYLTVEIPGVDKKDVKISVTENGIEITAERKEVLKKKEKGLYHYERSYSGFHRFFSVPKKINPNKATADYKDGLVKITIPKVKEKKKVVEVTTKV